jgi:predicted transcriptional regulator
MAGRKTLTITDRQYQVLQILWDRGPLTVRELMQHLPRGERQPYTTALGLVQNMERQGLLGHVKEGVTHRYVPLVDRRQMTGRLVQDFLNRFFGGSAEALVLGLVDAAALSPQELGELEAKLSATAGETQAPSAAGTAPHGTRETRGNRQRKGTK